MGIEKRKGRLYLYERKRVNGRLRGVYLFPLSADMEQLVRAQARLNWLQKVQTRLEVEEVAEWAAGVLDAGAAFDRLADRVFRAGMFLTGHTLHKRSEWRRKHGGAAMANVSELLGKPVKPKPAMIVPKSIDPKVQEILDRAAIGDSSVLPAVKKLFTDPSFRGTYGSVAHWAKLSLVRMAAGDNIAIAEGVSASLDEHVEKLLADSGPNPTYAERMAAKRVAHNWLAVHILETKMTDWDESSPPAAVISKQLSRAERRLQASLKSLAVLCRLRRSVVVAQVNVAADPKLLADGGNRQACRTAGREGSG